MMGMPGSEISGFSGLVIAFESAFTSPLGAGVGSAVDAAAAVGGAGVGVRAGAAVRAEAAVGAGAEGTGTFSGALEG